MRAHPDLLADQDASPAGLRPWASRTSGGRRMCICKSISLYPARRYIATAFVSTLLVSSLTTAWPRSAAPSHTRSIRPPSPPSPVLVDIRLISAVRSSSRWRQPQATGSPSDIASGRARSAQERVEHSSPGAAPVEADGPARRRRRGRGRVGRRITRRDHRRGGPQATGTSRGPRPAGAGPVRERLDDHAPVPTGRRGPEAPGDPQP